MFRLFLYALPLSSFLAVAHPCVSYSGSDRFQDESVRRLYREHHRVLDTELYGTSASLWSLPILMRFSQATSFTRKRTAICHFPHL